MTIEITKKLIVKNNQNAILFDKSFTLFAHLKIKKLVL